MGGRWRRRCIESQMFEVKENRGGRGLERRWRSKQRRSYIANNSPQDDRGGQEKEETRSMCIGLSKNSAQSFIPPPSFLLLFSPSVRPSRGVQQQQQQRTIKRINCLDDQEKPLLSKRFTPGALPFHYLPNFFVSAFGCIRNNSLPFVVHITGLDLLQR
jgi:hypothetical protein